MAIIYRTWTVTLESRRLSPGTTWYFRSEDEVRQFEKEERVRLARYGITGVRFIKKWHDWIDEVGTVRNSDGYVKEGF